MDVEYTLTFENQTALVSSFGASLRRYSIATSRGDWNVLWGYEGTANKKGGQGDVLIPFPGRIKNGTYNFEGTTHELIKNDKDGPNAIHGFLRAETFQIVSVTETKAVFGYQITAQKYSQRGFPFSLDVEISYELTKNGLTTSFVIKNVGTTSAPVGVGFHPYFRADEGELADWTVKIPARNYVELEQLVPTGKIPAVNGTRFDFRAGKNVDKDEYNACLANLDRDRDGYARALLQFKNSKNRVIITIDKSFDYIVIYTGDAIPTPHQRQGFAIEPMTCAPDAFNHIGDDADWGTRVLAPSAEFRGAYTVLGELNQD